MARRVRALAIVLCVLAICRGGVAQSTSPSGNGIGNASFEQTSTPSGGAVDPGSNALVSWNVTSSAATVYGSDLLAPADGITSVALGTNGGAISQTIATVPGQAYTLSFYSAPLPFDNTHSVVNEFDVTFGGAFVKKVSAVHAGVSGIPAWTRYEVTLTATDTATELRFANTSPSAGAPLLDQISLFTNLVGNPGFETGFVFSGQPQFAGSTVHAPWVISGNGEVITWGASQLTPADGETLGAFLSGHMTLSQTITTSPGQAYTLSFSFAPAVDLSHSHVSQLAVAWGGQPVAVVSGVHTGNTNLLQWRRYEFTVVATSSTTELAFTDNDAFIFSPNLDAVSLTMNLAGNGSFEQTSGQSGLIAAGSAALSPWSVGGTAVNVRGNASWVPAEGANSIAFDAGSSSLTQVISTVPGQTYTVAFYFAPQPSDNSHSLINQLNVLWGGALVKSVTAVHTGAPGVPQWTRYEASVTATATQTQLTFNDADAYDLSPLLDQVAVVASAPSNVVSQPLSVHLDAPMAGETYTSGGGQFPARWTAAGPRSSFDMQLSLDGGVTFTPVPGCTGVPGSITHCVWTPVSPPTSTAIMRVIAHALDGTTASDETDGPFSFASAFTLTSPSAGDTWAVGSTHFISWQQMVSPASPPSFELSRDGGDTWESIATVPTFNNFVAWTVTGPETPNAVIRMTANGFSVSSGVFTIGGSGILLVSPSSGDTWQIGTSRRISFTQTIGNGERAIFEVTRDEGASWEFIAGVDLHADTSAAWWQVTPWATDHVRIRVRLESTPSVSDLSAEFTIVDGPPVPGPAGNIVVNGSFDQNAPAPGNSLPPGSTEIAPWSITADAVTTTSDAVDPVNEHDFALAFGAGVGSISQTIPTLVGHTYTLSFYAAPSPFSQTNQGRLDVSWDGAVVKSVTAIQPDATGVAHWTHYEATVIATATTSVLTFTDTDESTGSPLLDRVELRENLIANGSFDFNMPSDGVFGFFGFPTSTIGAWTLDGFATWYGPTFYPGVDRGVLAFRANASLSQDVPTVPGQTYKLSYYIAAPPTPDPARIGQINVLWGGSVVQSASAAPTTEPPFLPHWVRYEATVTAVDTVTHLTFADADPYDESPLLDQISLVLQEQPFEVALETQNDGGSYLSRTQTEIRWSVEGTPTSFDVEFSDDDGETYSPIGECTGLPASARSCLWNVPFVLSEHSRIRVTAHDATGRVASDVSDNPFPIFNLVGYTISDPAPAAKWPVGSTQTIRWTPFFSNSSSDGPTPRVTIELSRDGGNFRTIVEETSSREVAWDVTDPLTSNAVVRVRWLDGDASLISEPFAIVNPPAPTPAGSSIAVTPFDTRTNSSPVTLTFENVTVAGDTTLNNVFGEGPPLTDPTLVVPVPPTYYDITTTAQYSGSITVCVSMDRLSFPPGTSPRLLEFENGQWVDITTSSTGDVVCGSATSLSLFTVAGRRDTTPPVVTCGTADGQWHATNISIACTAVDAGAGLANPADASFTLTTNVAAGDENANAATGSRTVCDAVNNCTTVGPIAGNKIDRRGPSITVTAPTAGVYTLGQVVSAAYLCTDAGSGVASCSGPVASGAALDTSSLGAKTFVVNATDNVGNATSVTVSYVVSLGGLATSAGPSTIWLSLKTTDDVGTKFDVLAEMLKNGAVVATGQVNDVTPGTGFGGAVQQAIGMALGSATNLNPGDSLGVRLSVRIASTGHRSGTARLWYGDAGANSRFLMVVNGVTRPLYLATGFELTLATGVGPKTFTDVFADRNVNGNPFKAFGTWTLIF